MPQAQANPSRYNIRFRNAAEPASVTTIDVFSEIDGWWGYGLQSLAYDLHGRTEDVRVRVSSYGGDLLNGISMMQFLRQYPGNVTTEVLGIAASAATFVVQGGDHIAMNAGSFYMIHNPFSWSGGTAAEMDSQAAALRKMQDEMVNIYAAGIRKRGKMADLSDEELTAQIQAWMDAETWFSAADALEYGFIDEISQGETATAASDTALQTMAANPAAFNSFRNTPERVLNFATKMAKPNTPPTTPAPKGPLATLLAGLKNLLVVAEAEVTEAPAAPPAVPEAEPAAVIDPIEEAKKLLADSGYTVAEASAEPDEAEEEEESEKTYTEAEVQAMLASAKSDTAKKAAGKNPTNKPAAAPTTARTKADAIRASKLQGFDALAAMVKR
jgi:ATP-dependent Clp protease protease subunit